MIKYRTERLWGEGYRDAIEVMAHETFGLGNSDIPETLAKTILKGTSIEEELLQLEYVLSQDYFEEDISHNKELAKFISIWEKYEDGEEEDAILFFEKVLDVIKTKIGKNIKYCLWLCDTKEDIIEEYDMHNELDENSFDAYEDSNVILSDLGSGGKLYGYEEYPNPCNI